MLMRHGHALRRPPFIADEAHGEAAVPRHYADGFDARWLRCGRGERAAANILPRSLCRCSLGRCEAPRDCQRYGRYTGHS